MPREKLALVALALMLTLSGCANIAVDVDVKNESTIEKYEVEAEVSELVYSRFAEEARSQGYGGIDELVREAAGNDDAIGDYSYSESRSSGIITINMIVKDVNVLASDAPIDITELENGNLWYEDRTFLEYRYGDDSLRVNYTLTMPGEIESATTNRTDGRTARWSYKKGESEQGLHISAESKPPLVEKAPGFTALTALSALFLSFLAVLGKHRQN